MCKFNFNLILQNVNLFNISIENIFYKIIYFNFIEDRKLEYLNINTFDK